MSHPRGRPSGLAGLALALLALAGCAGTPQPASSPAATPLASTTPVPVAARALAALVEDHLGAGLVAYDERSSASVEAVVLYGAAPWATTRTVVLEYGDGPAWAVDERACSDASTGTPPVQCESREGVRVGWTPERDMVWVASPRASGVVTVWLSDAGLTKETPEEEMRAAVSPLIALAKDPRADATTVPQPMTTPWNDDPECAAARSPAPLRTPPARSSEPAQAPTPRALVAMVAERVRGVCGWGRVDHPNTADVAGTLYLGGSADEQVTAAVTTKKPDCKGMDDCAKRADLTIAWQFDVPEEYPATVWVSRPIPGGYLVITHTSKRADHKTRKFPVPLDTLVALARDERFGFTVDPALNRAGDELPLCWRLLASTGG